MPRDVLFEGAIKISEDSDDSIVLGIRAVGSARLLNGKLSLSISNTASPGRSTSLALNFLFAPDLRD